LATKAFHVSSHYDTAILIISILMKPFYKESIADGQVLRYGENPHQKDFSLVILMPCLTKFTEKNHITILDVDAAVNLINEFKMMGLHLPYLNTTMLVVCYKNYN
jgi:phosphoribosylaminoimidazolecarboxamide formyltransferase/IMP cyclohydrolase